ncbi:hypothetical protein D7Y13_28005 [Corallococcus praedator]|uniref:Sugar-binding protein n=1 Tax=Corallococcus praedator TaxID=2316724 RepID=A0ABX9QAX1_9BACT|nr:MULTISPECIES: hypothetical protein [Corallococcus]RKH22684.1 hypothetical protein D7X75_35045 [Corallococcus sp. CA031C]RKH99158.1 hypothetical protein D7Y13_28005 [Corallococcus praedator]
MALAPVSRKPLAPVTPPAITEKAAPQKGASTPVEAKKPAVVGDAFEVKKAATGPVLGEAANAPAIAGLRVGLAAAGKAVAKPAVEGPPPERQTVSGEDKAKQAVDLKNVAERRTETVEAQTSLREKTTQEADKLFAMADGKEPVPAGSNIQRVSESEVELTRVNDKKEVVERSVATKKDGAVTVDSATYEDGTHKRDRLEMKADGGTLVERAEWKGDKNETADLKSFGDISKTRDRGLTYTRNEVSTEKNKDGDRLITNAYTQADGGATSSRTSFYQQKGGGSIDNKLKGPFDFKKPVDRADTYSYSIPPPGEDGKQGDVQYSRVQDFSQDNVKATSYVDRTLDGHTHLAGKEPHTIEDLHTVRDEYGKGGGENWDADKAGEGRPPKRWTVDLQKGPDRLDSQTFIEGYPDATIKTERTREGSTVKEKYEGKTFEKEDSSKRVPVNGESSTTFGQDGSVEKMDSRSREADGSDLEQHYNSSRKATNAWLELQESLETKRTKDNKTESSLKEDTSLLSSEGAQLVNSRTTVTDAEGRKGVHEVGKDGEKMQLSGPEGRDMRDVSNPDDFKDDAFGKVLLEQASISTASTVNQYANSGGAQALNVLKGLSQDAGRLPEKATAILGKDTLSKGLNAAQGGASALGGVAGVVAGGMSLARGIRENNMPDIVKGVTDTANGALNLYTGGQAFTEAIKGFKNAGALTTTAPAAKAMPWAKTLANPKVGGAVTSVVLDSVKGMGGIGKVAGATASAGSKALSALKGMGGAANVLGAVGGTVGGVFDIVNGAKVNDGAQIAKGAVGIAGSLGGAVAVGAIGGPLGMAVGAGIGLLTFGIGKIMDAISDKPHKISELQID